MFFLFTFSCFSFSLLTSFFRNCRVRLGDIRKRSALAHSLIRLLLVDRERWVQSPPTLFGASRKYFRTYSTYSVTSPSHHQPTPLYPRQCLPTRRNTTLGTFGTHFLRLGVVCRSSLSQSSSFRNARTLFNHNASHFGKHTELQSSDHGKLTGVKTLDYYLERNRVAAVPSGERNFHIFYYLIAGASPEKLHLHLLDKAMYRYLGPRGTTSTRPNEGRDDDGLIGSK